MEDHATRRIGRVLVGISTLIAVTFTPRPALAADETTEPAADQSVSVSPMPLRTDELHLATAAEQTPLRIFDFNMCGAKCSRGAYGAGTVVEAVARSLLDYRPQFVALQEICDAQFVRLVQLLGTPALMDWGGQVAPAPWPMSGAHEATVTGPALQGACLPNQFDGELRYGVAALTSEPISNRSAGDPFAQNRAVGENYPLPYDRAGGQEPRTMFCIRFVVRGGSAEHRGCSAHLTPADAPGQDPWNRRQLQRIADILVPKSNVGSPIVVGIDSYRETVDMSFYLTNFYDADTGPVEDKTFFNDCPICPGSGALLYRYDHIMASQTYAVTEGEATATAYSDHLPLRGRVALGGTYRAADLEAPAYLTEQADQAGWRSQFGGTTYPPDETSYESYFLPFDHRRIGRSRVTTTCCVQFRTENAFMNFDTSAVPDGAYITRARLRLHVASIENADDRSVVGEYYRYHVSVTGGEAPSTTNDASDTAFSDVALSSIAPGEVIVELRNLHLISTTATTGFRLHISGGEPTGINQVRLNPVVDVSGELAPAELLIEYSMT